LDAPGSSDKTMTSAYAVDKYFSIFSREANHLKNIFAIVGQPTRGVTNSTATAARRQLTLV
jgi:hypothetical protein